MAVPSPVPRISLYTYATWLSKAMTSEFGRLYARWFRNHFKVQNLDAWAADHKAMVHDCAGDFHEAGCEVYLEEQNTLRVQGRGGAVLVGKPDIVAVKGNTVIVVDCKTGNSRTSDSL